MTRLESIVRVKSDIVNNNSGCAAELSALLSSSEAAAKVLRKRQKALEPVLAEGASALGRVRFEAVPWNSGDAEAVRVLLKRELCGCMASFAAELAKALKQAGLPCTFLGTQESGNVPEAAEMHPEEPLTVRSGIIRAEADFALEKAVLFFCGVKCAEAKLGSAGELAEEIVDLTVRFKGGTVPADVMAGRLVLAASLSESAGDAFTVGGLWPVVHRIGLMAGGLGKSPSRAGLGCYSIFDYLAGVRNVILSTEASGGWVKASKSNAAVKICANPEDLSLESKVELRDE